MQTCQSLLDCVIARATAQLPSYTHRLGQTSAGKDDGRKKALRNGKVRVGRLMLGQVTARGASLSSLGSRLGGRESVASLSCSSEEDDADAAFQPHWLPAVVSLVNPFSIEEDEEEEEEKDEEDAKCVRIHELHRQECACLALRILNGLLSCDFPASSIRQCLSALWSKFSASSVRFVVAPFHRHTHIKKTSLKAIFSARCETTFAINVCHWEAQSLKKLPPTP